MKATTPDQAELIESVLAESDVGLLTASILEKDVHASDVLRVALDIQHPNTRLIFAVV